MFNKNRILCICLCISGISACTTDTSTVVTNYQPFKYDNAELYSEGYESTTYVDNNYPDEPQDKKPVSVPNTYFVGTSNAPTSHKDLDKSWVKSQSAEGYTIELSNSEKAADVAGTLFKAPKSERSAEVEYQREGKTYYKGVYGSYPNKDAAVQALKQLPTDVQQQAAIQSWKNVQNGLDE